MNSVNQFLRNKDFSWALNRVVEWNLVARSGKHDFSEKTIEFQKTLVEEETTELRDAIEANDKVEALDALCDMFVVGAYWYFLQNEGKPNIFFCGDPTPGVDYAVLARFNIQQNSSYLFVLDVAHMLYQFEGNVRGALEEVLASNDSKFPKVEVKTGSEGRLEGMSVGDEYLTPEEMCTWIEAVNEGRYTGVTYKVVGKGDNRRYVFLSDKGKIMKPKCFFKPDLTEFV